MFCNISQPPAGWLLLLGHDPANILLGVITPVQEILPASWVCVRFGQVSVSCWVSGLQTRLCVSLPSACTQAWSFFTIGWTIYPATISTCMHHNHNLHRRRASCGAHSQSRCILRKPTACHSSCSCSHILNWFSSLIFLLSQALSMPPFCTIGGSE